jgi:hypothetical protein
MEKIDFVLPWVDGSDLVWQQNKEKHNPVKSSENSPSRFRDMETLKYVLRSIEKNYPWYNKIYLITEGHYPKWLDINHEKIVLVTHDELYFDKTHLPTFSSSSIEMNLPNLQGLSEHFVYLNDDTLIMRPIEKSRFFIDGLPVDFLSHGWIPRNKFFGMFRRMDAWVYSINNNLNLINRKFSPIRLEKMYLYHSTYNFKTKLSNFLLSNIYKKFVWIEHWHHPIPYLRSTLKDVYNEFEKEMMTCSSNKFRKNNDLTQYLYRYWQLASGNFYPYKHNDAIIANITSINILNDMLNVIEKNEDINFVCFNDDLDLSDSEFLVVKNKLKSFLEKTFPNKASFEVKK